MKNIIDARVIDKHVIQKYNFKILSSYGSKNDNNKSDNEEDTTNLSSDNPQEQKLDNEIEEKKAQEIKDDFIAELLEKSDKMSSELVKLQMQIEEGQKEFEKRLEQTKQQAFDEGQKVGYDKAKKELESQHEEVKQHYVESIKKLDKIYNECKIKMDELKSDLSDVSLEIAEEVISLEVSEKSKEIASSLASKLLEDIKDATNIELKVNPNDYEYIKTKFSDNPNIIITKDSAISEGGVVLMSDIGNIDGDINVRFEKIKQLVMVKNDN